MLASSEEFNRNLMRI